MARPEWSPNESYLRKLERLAFALVRTRPSREPRESRKKNLWIDKCKGLAGPFAIAILIGIPFVAENSTGPIIVASLLLAAVDACLAVWCYTDFECRHGHCSGDLYKCIFGCVGEFPAFLVGWWRVQAFSAGFAACSRTLSSIMDSVTGRHVETLLENALGSFTPLGAPLDVLAVGVTAVPTIMCAIGMEESGFLRFCLYLLTSFTTLTIFSSALASSHLVQPLDTIPDIADRNIYAKILTGAMLASIGFLGLYKVCRPDNMTLKQHQHFQVNKRFSLTGCVISSVAFLFYFLESTVLNKVQPLSSIWDGDPPLLWPLDGGWRLGVASLGIASLALATFEFLIPMCVTVTKLSNDGLLYRNLRKDEHDLEETKWNLVTPLIFGSVSALQALLIDTKVLLGLVSSSLMCIHILVGAAMLASRYQVRTCPSPHRKIYHSRTRPRARGSPNPASAHQTRRLMTVSFLKSGMSKIPREMIDELDASRAGASRTDPNCDRTYLMDDVSIAPIEPRGSTDFSVGSGVSGYESDSDPEIYQSDTANETDIDAAVSEYQERIRVAGINGAMPINPTGATARRVSFATMALVPCCLALAASFNRAPRGHLTGIMLAVSSGLLTFLLLVVISRQPQKRRAAKAAATAAAAASGTPPERASLFSNFFQYSIVPWGPAAAIFLHSCLLLEALDLSGFPFAFWLSTGLIIYFSYGVSKSVAAPASLVIPAERVRLNESASRQPLQALGPNEPSTSSGGSNNGTMSNNPDSYEQAENVVIS